MENRRLTVLFWDLNVMKKRMCEWLIVFGCRKCIFIFKFCPFLSFGKTNTVPLYPFPILQTLGDFEEGGRGEKSGCSCTITS